MRYWREIVLLVGILSYFMGARTATHASETTVMQHTAGVNIAKLHASRYRLRHIVKPQLFEGNLSAVISWGDDVASRTNVNLQDVTRIASGNAHHLALRAGGTLVAWGNNIKNQATVPPELSNTNNPEEIIDFVAGDMHNVVISIQRDPDTYEATYKVRAWGDSSKSKTALPTKLISPNTVPIMLAAGSNHTLAYITETNPVTYATTSRVISWGNGSDTSVPAVLNPVDTDNRNLIQLQANGNHNAALLSDGSVVEWYTTGGVTIHTPSAGIFYEHIAVGSNFLLLVDNNGEMRGFGDNSKGQISIPLTSSCWTQVSAGALHVVAMDCEGNVYTWGDNSKKQLNVPLDMPRNLESVLGISSRGDHTLVLYQIPPTYQLMQWGSNASVLPRIQTGYLDMAAGINHTMAILSDSTVIAWGDNSYGQSTVPAALRNTVAIANGTNHSLAIDYDGVIWGWGSNAAGQLNTPDNLGVVDIIAAGRDFSIAHAMTETGQVDGNGAPILTDTVTIWGNSNKTLPAGLFNVSQLKCFDNHCAATVVRQVDVDGTPTDQTHIIDWVYTSDSENSKVVTVRQPPNSNTTFDAAVFSVGGTHTLIQQYYHIFDETVNPPVERSELTVRGFLVSGSDVGQARNQVIYDQTSTTMPAIELLSAGDTHSIAILSDGTAKCWPLLSPGCAIPNYLADFQLVSAGKNYTASMVFVDTSRDPTETPSITKTATATATRTASSTRTATRTPTSTSTRTNTRTATSTATRSNTRTATRTATSSSTRTATNTRTNTRTATPSRTATASRTATPTR